MSTSATEIIPNLWLGAEKDAANTGFINSMGIKTIINCTKECDFFTDHTTNIRIPVKDDLTLDQMILLFNYFPKATEFIHKELNNYKPVLVRCYQGKQRSCAVIAAYLMRYYHMSYMEAIRVIQSKRNIAFSPGANFKKSLEEWELHLSKKYT